MICSELLLIKSTDYICRLVKHCPQSCFSVVYLLFWPFNVFFSPFFSSLAAFNTSQAWFHVCVSPQRRKTRSPRVTKSLQERTRIETTKLKLLYKL